MAGWVCDRHSTRPFTDKQCDDRKAKKQFEPGKDPNHLAPARMGHDPPRQGRNESGTRALRGCRHTECKSAVRIKPCRNGASIGDEICGALTRPIKAKAA